MDRVWSEIRAGALPLLGNALHPVSQADSFLGLVRLLWRRLCGQDFLSACAELSIFARWGCYYLRNMRSLPFRITLSLKSRSTGVFYLDRRDITGGPRRFGQRLCS